MVDDFVARLPIDVNTSEDITDFDPDAVESDDFLDDPAEVIDDPDAIESLIVPIEEIFEEDEIV